MKKILFAASECVPFIKTGGLADVCGALPKEFDKEEWDVRVVIPNYSCIPEKYRSQFEYVTHFYMSAGTYRTDPSGCKHGMANRLCKTRFLCK